MTDLRREARALHRAAFGRDIPGEVERRYVEAHEILLARASETEREWMRRAVEEGLDLEALEIALRRRRPDHILTRKFRLLVGVAEAFPEYYGDFLNETPGRWRGILALAGAALRAVRKRLKGSLLLRMRGLA